ncbi:MAG: glycosyltransferase [Candidatus Micrarchaeales archaeon]
MAYTVLFDSYIAFVALIGIGMLALSLRTYKQEIVGNNYNPKVLVIVPCRGKDLTLEKNLQSLKEQMYKNCDILCVVDDTHDIALKTIKKLKIPYIQAAPKFPNASGKVRAIATAIEKRNRYEVYTIADSDVWFEREWLSKLVAPLKDKSYGLSTAYPFFNPSNGTWSKIKSAWGMVGEGLMESKITRFGWGGSLAFRKDLLNGKNFELFSESISDDIALTTLNQKRGLQIFYSGNADIRVNLKENSHTFFEWANRQTALSLLGYEKNFYFGVAFYFSQILLFISGIVLGIIVNAIFLLLLTPFILGAIRGYNRLREKYPEYFLIAVFLPFLYLSTLFVAKGIKEIQWRGRKYKLKR